jgi:predicted CoA-binding protein
MPDGDKQRIDLFLTLKRVALIGVSRDPKSLGAMLLLEFRKNGFDAIPVNPNAAELHGANCYARVADISPVPDWALVLPEDCSALVQECQAAGIRKLWLYGYLGPKKVDAAARDYCREQGLEFVAGYCPFMFLPGTHWFHRMHGGILKLIGQYPR